MEENKKDQHSAKADEDGYIYPRYITRNGEKIYPKNAKTFRIPVSSLKNK